MPSSSLAQWQTNRMPRLNDFDAQCAAALLGVPARPDLVDEYLRAYVLLLSAHFQGFCRDLHTESAQKIVAKTRRSLQILIQTQFIAHRKLDRGNPNLQNLRADFERFGFRLDLISADPANSGRIAQLEQMNNWRNTAAHDGTPPAGIPLKLATLQAWRTSCDGMAASLDLVMYNELRRILRRKPWLP